MYLNTREMKAVMYEYRMDDIAEGDISIIEEGIQAGITEVKAYLTPSSQARFVDGRPRYDVQAIFSATGNDRDPFILRLCKTVAAWNICELSNVDIIYDHVKERYAGAIRTLEKIAGVGEYADSPTITPDLPTLPGVADDPQPFRYGSRNKFTHEY